MKNLKGVIGYTVGALFSILTLAWNALAMYGTKNIGSVSLYDAYKNADQFDLLKKLGYGNLYAGRILSIITLVIACLLAVTCVLGLLNELGVVKIKFMSYVNYALAALFVVFALVALILVAVDCKDPTYVGAGMIMVLITSLVSLAGILYATLSGKKSTK